MEALIIVGIIVVALLVMAGILFVILAPILTQISAARAGTKAARARTAQLRDHPDA